MIRCFITRFFASRLTLFYSSGFLGSGWAFSMIELEVVYFLFNLSFAHYLQNYSDDTIIFVLVLSATHFLARLSKKSRGVA